MISQTLPIFWDTSLFYRNTWHPARHSSAFGTNEGTRHWKISAFKECRPAGSENADRFWASLASEFLLGSKERPLITKIYKIKNVCNILKHHLPSAILWKHSRSHWNSKPGNLQNIWSKHCNATAELPFQIPAHCFSEHWSGVRHPVAIICLNRVTKSHYRSTQIDLAPIKLKPFASTCDAKTWIVWTMYIETTRNCSANNPANAERLPNSKVSVFQEACHLLSPPPLWPELLACWNQLHIPYPALGASHLWSNLAEMLEMLPLHRATWHSGKLETPSSAAPSCRQIGFVKRAR